LKTAQDIKVNNVILIDGAPWIVQRAEYTKSGRNSAIMKMKLKNLLSGSTSETVYKFDDKMEQVILDQIDVTYSYKADDMYVFVDEEYNQYELSAEDIESVMPYIVDGMTDVCSAVFLKVRLSQWTFQRQLFVRSTTPRRLLAVIPAAR